MSKIVSIKYAKAPTACLYEKDCREFVEAGQLIRYVMSIIYDELKDVQNYCESQVTTCKVIACVPSMVRIDIVRTKFRQLTACFQFPEKYPSNPLLVELKSKTLKELFLSRLTKLCEEECKKNLGRPQILSVLKFLELFLEENPLCVCSDELSSLKKELGEHDEVRIKQKLSSILLYFKEEQYFVKVKVFIPDDYPDQSIKLEIGECNFPCNFQRWFLGQSTEIARRCVQKPLKPKPKDPPFQPKPSLWPAVKFVLDEVKRLPSQSCQLCKKKCFPDDPKEIINDKSSPEHIERVYCGHLFHNHCLDTYMKTPPFQGGKKCPQCQLVIYHEKWKIAPKLAEDRWAHKEAKKRELGEVVEFFS